MRIALLASLAFAFGTSLFAQQVELLQAPSEGRAHFMEQFEFDLIDDHTATIGINRAGITTPPTGSIRTMAEWEEIETLVLTWTSYTSILKEIVRHAKEEVQVIIYASNPNSVSNTLLGSSGGGPLNNLNNVTIVQGNYDSIWIRDFGAETVYWNDVDSLFLLDWIYNRPRPNDDALPDAYAAYLNLPIYSTTAAPYDLVHTGGNFMSDGFGTGFSSELVTDENGPSGQFNLTNKTQADIDTIMNLFMGIDHGRYVIMDELPFDIISHIDMHMKLLDEETLLIGEFPTGQSDGPQIEANIQYILSNYNSVFGTPYKIVRIPMPPSTGGNYAPNAYYRTFTNSIFLNKTILVPTYRQQYDTTAMRIYRENLPGYNVVAIDCDNNGSNIISAAGALHCITKTIGVQDPLLITHQPLPDTNDDQNPYTVDAWMKHTSGISSATMYWTLDTAAGFNAVPMTLVSGNDWTADIPAQTIGSRVFYYVEGTANSGKTQVRPLVAPAGWWDFIVDGTVGIVDKEDAGFMDIYPNPASAITVIPFTNDEAGPLSIDLFDAMGRLVQNIHSGTSTAGAVNYFIDATELPSGSYRVVATNGSGRWTSQLIVR